MRWSTTIVNSIPILTSCSSRLPSCHRNRNLSQFSSVFNGTEYHHYSTMSTPRSTSPTSDMFKYTSGRYLYNETLRLAERYINFDVEALKRIVVQSVNREHVSHMMKLAEGGFNRVFLLEMDDGLEVVVKIPYSILVPKELTTKSEVATLDFLRLQGIPVPKVYAWSSNAENEVGTEYIIMEKAPGKPLQDRWFSLTPKEQLRLVTSYVGVERKLFSIPFGSYGSIYYSTSLPQHLQAHLHSGTGGENGDISRFCIGPVADYMFWRGKRADLGVDRGPCESKTLIRIIFSLK